MAYTLDQHQVAQLRELVGAGIDGIGDVALDVDRVAVHELNPQIAGVVADLGLTGVSVTAPPRIPLPTPYHLDVRAFESALRSELSASVAGCAYELRQGGRTVFSGSVQDARMAGDSTAGVPAVPWTTQERMHVASCSKLVTAIAMTRVLAEHGVAASTPVAAYLPDYWVRGPNVGRITFAQLMTHTSGLGTAATTDSDFLLMKSRVADGVAVAPAYLYQNVNFGLCRILIATVNGDVSPAMRVGLGLDDVVWDSATLNAYVAYVEQNVMGPAGVSGTELGYRVGHALGYPFPRKIPGFASGDLRSWVGGVGWHLSVDELLRVMGTLRRAGTILSPAAAEVMLGRTFGVDSVISTRAGVIYEKTGWWVDGVRIQHSVALFLPEDMELVILANSGFGVPNANMLGRVSALYQECLKEKPRFPSGPTVVPAFVYGIEPDGDLVWYRHDGAETGGGIATWRGPANVGVGWGTAAHVFPAGGDALYLIDTEGRLWWYEHKGFTIGDGLGTPDGWAGPRQVGHGWGDVARVFSGGDGVIYIVDTEGRLLWYRHHGVASGEGLETPGSWSGPREVGVGWGTALHLFSTGGGVIYAVMPDGTLRWYRHDGFVDGRGLDSPGAWSGPVDVGSGWADVTQVFSRGAGVIYAVMPDGTLRWFCHDGYRTGAVQWRGPVDVGTGWDAFSTVFALLPREPSPVR
ncbi:serine hydrolase [Cellulomonas humilata]|uniref:Serine hydrolase n=1 Tax=Cellulomonas humilata TaxID=144055 RepID=A0A7Y6A3H3_9CELL|nr:tachylectin-related carbohydrate-binding protein [Cellulomonas humilata]NUU17809.1 serine hydrolase [Cellulomonas humilata]